MATDPEMLWRTLESGSEPGARLRALDGIVRGAAPGDRATRRRLIDLAARLPD